MARSSSAIRSSISNSPSSCANCVLRGSANFLFTSRASSAMSARTFASSARIDSSSAIVFCSSSYSARSLSCSSAVSRRSGMSKMWFAWISVRP